MTKMQIAEYYPKNLYWQVMFNIFRLYVEIIYDSLDFIVLQLNYMTLSLYIKFDIYFL